MSHVGKWRTVVLHTLKEGWLLVKRSPVVEMQDIKLGQDCDTWTSITV